MSDYGTVDLCRTCGSALRGAARHIGVCVECLATPKFPLLTLARPQYGRPEESTDAETPPRP
jgi:hypothetical protein